MPAQNLHEDLQREDKVEIGSDRSFGLIVGGLLALLGIWGWYRGPGHLLWHVGLWLLLPGVPLVVLGLAWPVLLRPLNILWFKFGLVLAAIIPPALLGFFFYVMITPFAITFRMFSRKPLGVGNNVVSGSYWIKRDGAPSLQGFKDQF
jgi:hypothetical protein